VIKERKLTWDGVGCIVGVLVSDIGSTFQREVLGGFNRITNPFVPLAF